MFKTKSGPSLSFMDGAHPAPVFRIGVWLLATAWVAVALNAVPWWVRADAHWGHQPLPWNWLGPLGEAFLVSGVTGLLFALLMAAGKWPARISGVLLIVISAAAAYFMTRYRVVIGYGVLNAVYTTDHDLSGEITGWWLFLWISLLGVLPAALWWRRTNGPGIWAGLRHGAWIKSWCGVLCVSVVLAVVGHKVLDRARVVLAGQIAADTNYSGVTAHSYLPSNWVAGSALVLANRIKQAQDEARLQDPAKLHRFMPQADLNDAVVVMVIGETTRSDRMGVLGHDRNTTPHLASNPNAAVFAGWSCDTVTKLSLACMFVRPQGIEPGRKGLPDRILEDNIFGVLKHLSFAVDLFAMQSEAGFYLKVRPDNIKVREVLAAQNENAGKPLNDMLLVPEVAQALKQRKGERRPHLIVLHTKGSHAMYSQRYPREFAKWQPECMNADDFCDVQALFNAFDNSVLFVDHVLNELQKTLANRKALLIYTSDHGESIDENQHFHATPREIAPPEQRRVPLVFWASPTWRADPVLGQRFDRLLQRAQQAKARSVDDPSIGHHNIFASTLGCAGFDSPDGGIASELDLCH